MFFVGTFFSSRATSLSVLTLPMPVSTVSALVAASASFSSLVGLVRVSLEDILRISEARNCCCTLMRSRSPELPKACRVRRKASAVSPSIVCLPAESLSLRVLVVDVLGEADLDAVHRRGQRLDRVEVGHHEVVGRDAGDLLDRAHGAARVPAVLAEARVEADARRARDDLGACRPPASSGSPGCRRSGRAGCSTRSRSYGPWRRAAGSWCRRARRCPSRRSPRCPHRCACPYR